MLDNIENFNFRDKINQVLKNTYIKIDADESNSYTRWKSSDFSYFSFEEKDEGDDYDI